MRGRIIIPLDGRNLILPRQDADKLLRSLSLINHEAALLLHNDWGMEVPVVITRSSIYIFLPVPNAETRIVARDRLEFTLTLGELLSRLPPWVEVIP